MTAYLSALLLCTASIAVGAALCCRQREWSWTAPPVGLAALMLLVLGAVRLPGHGTTAALVGALAAVVSAALAARRRVALAPLADALPVAAAVLALCSLPFLANDRIGELGASINSDLVAHLAQAEALSKAGSGHITSPGYPNGPHAAVAALDSGLGVGASTGFTGLLLATPVLLALTALGALGGAKWYLRLPAAVLVGVPYLAASYFAEGAFKEPLLALFFLGFVLTLSEAHTSGRRDARTAVGLILTPAAGIAVFGIAALAWFGGALMWVATLELLGGRRPGLVRWRLRSWLPALAVAAAVGVVALATGGDVFESDADQFFAAKESGGNFFGQLSPLEALGVWHQADFRVSPGSPLLDPGILLACAVVIFGFVWCWLRREWALVAGALGAISVYFVARPLATAYFSGKALAVAAPMLMLLAVRALTAVASSARPQALSRLAVAPLVAMAALTAYLVLAVVSSTLALRGAHVRPAERGHDLTAFRSTVEGEPTVYLGRDNYAPWELRGAQLRGFQSYATALGAGLHDPPAKHAGALLATAADVDSVGSKLLGWARYLVAPRTAYASVPPPNFAPVERTRWHVLWKRRGPVAPRRILAEGEAPGRVMDCRSDRDRRLSHMPGVAYVRPQPVVGPPHDWRTEAGRPPGRPGDARNGDQRFQELRLGPGTWEVSLRWFSDVPLHVRAGAIDASLPADVADPSTFARVGRIVSDGGPLRVTMTVPARRRVEVLRPVFLGTVAATRVDDRGGLVPLARACGRYVDWFRAGPDARE